MTVISVKAFNGLKPVVKPRLLSDADAQVAQNVRLVSGSLEPLRGTSTLKPTILGTPKTIFRYGSGATETDYWLEFERDTDVMRSPIPNDQYDRLYWTDGVNPPRYAPNSMVLASQPYPGAFYQLGLPAPEAPSIAGTGDTSTGQTFTITAAQISALGTTARIKATVATASGSTETILDIATVTAANVATALSTVVGLSAVVTVDDIVVTPDVSVTSVAFAAKKGTADNYDPLLVSYTPYLRLGDWNNATSGTRIAAVLDSSDPANPIVRGNPGSGSPIDPGTVGPASVLFDPATISAITPGTFIAIKVNGGAQVSVQVNAGAGTYPAAVTPQSLAAAFAGIYDLQTEVRQNVTYTVDGTPVTGTFVIVATKLDGGLASLLLRKITPVQSDVYGSPYTWTRNSTLDNIKETRVYLCCYVSAYGEEGPPSPASASVALSQGQSATIGLPGAPTGNYNITLKRIYRSSTVGSQAQWQFVSDVPVAQTTFVDTVLQADLGEVMPSEGWVAPPADLKGLRMMANGAAVGFSGRTVYMSEPNMPHAWPHKYTIDYDIVGIATYGQTVAVMTSAFPFLIQGADPAAMTPTKLEVPQACVSKRSIVETGDGVLYASPDGYVMLGSGIDVLTKSMFSRDQWQAYSPSSMDAYLYNGRIHLTYSTGSSSGMLIIDAGGQGAILTTCSFGSIHPFTAGYYDPTSDTLYLAQYGNIMRFDRSSPTVATWRSKVFRLPWQLNLSVGQVRAAAYPVVIRVYADGVKKVEQTINSDDIFTLPGGFRALDWEFEIDTTSEVSEVTLASSATEIKTV